MSGRGGQGIGHSGRGGCVGSRYRGCSRGSFNYTNTLNKNKGLCSALGNNVFDYGQKGAAHQMRTTWENIVHHARTIYGHDIRNKLNKKTKVSISKPEYTDDVQLKHKQRV